MATEDLEGRLSAIEQRLVAIERQLAPRFAWPQADAPARRDRPAAQPARVEPPLPTSHAASASAMGSAPPRMDPAGSSVRPAAVGEPRMATSLATSVLGWGGAVAFVLAAAYLVRLGIDNGWLTPLVQVATAVVAGVLLVGAGFGLREWSPEYSGYLPACGIVILFLAVYGAHLFYGLLTAPAAAGAVVAVCALSLWLHRAFDSGLYALFAVAGSYSAPFLLAGAHGSITDLVIYFSAWSVVFSVYAVWAGRRLVYLLAAYLALIGFDFVWHTQAPNAWVPALVFQAVQFAVFGVTTAWFSVRRHEPLDTATAVAHLPPLLLFYALQYYVLDRHLPGLAPWISILSLAAVGILYGVSRKVLARPLPGGELLLWCYLALVLFHAVYLETWPRAWAPWAPVILLPAAAWVTVRASLAAAGPRWVMWGTVGAIFILNYVRVVAGFRLGAVAGGSAVALVYAALLYAGYALVARRAGLREVKLLLVYAGHLSAMSAAVQLLDTAIVQSTAWGLLALACLVLSLRSGDRRLGQSSLLVFAASAVKVLLFDLAGAQPIVRIVSLVVLGATFYVGGWFYQRLLAGRGDAGAGRGTVSGDG